MTSTCDADSHRDDTELIRRGPEQGWNGIVAALARATAGQRIELAAGDYSGSTPLVVPPGVTLSGAAAGGDDSEPPAPRTRLHWQGEGSALRLQEADGARIERLHLIGHWSDPAEADALGDTGAALIHVIDSAEVEIHACRCDGGDRLAHGLHLQRTRGCRVEACAASDCRSGLLASSSTGLLAAHGHWFGNQSRGIVLYRDADTPDRPSEADLIANRCHDNAQSGIVYASSNGRAKGNDCWGNWMDGIVQQLLDAGRSAPDG